MQLRQTELLCEAGVFRAAKQFKKFPDYMGEQWRPDLTEGEARALLEDCLRVLFYRDCRASSLIQLGKCVSGEDHRATTTPLISDPYPLEHTSWNDPAFVQAAPAQLDGDGGW